jgi:hypothetical protein
MKTKRRKPYPCNARTCTMLRADGLECGTVERRLHGCNVTQDLFGLFDVIYLRPDGRSVYVQTSTQDGGRTEAIEAWPHVRDFVRHHEVEFWHWSKRRIESGKRKLWSVRILRLGFTSDGKTWWNDFGTRRAIQ